MAAITERLIEAAIKLAPPNSGQPRTFSESGKDTVTLSGFRCEAQISNDGAPGGSTLQFTVYGLSLSLMNQLSTLGMVYQLIPRNTITVTAGDAQSGLSTVFSGTVTQAYAEFEGAPEVPFHFEANSGLADAVAPATVSSYQGAADVATIMADLAKQMGLAFENSGVTAQLSNPYLSGSAMVQMRTCAEHAGINADIIDGATLAIWPKGGSRGGSVPLISKDTGMIGYPAFTAFGVSVQTLFNKQIRFGGQIKIQSILKPANRIWNTYKLDHDLASMLPGGKWHSTIFAYDPAYPQPVLQP